MRCRYVNRVQQAYKVMIQARRYERQGNEQAAVGAWCQIFGIEVGNNLIICGYLMALA